MVAAMPGQPQPGPIGWAFCAAHSGRLRRVSKRHGGVGRHRALQNLGRLATLVNRNHMYIETPAYRDRLPRPGIITLLAVLQYIGAGMLALLTAALLFGAIGTQDQIQRAVISVVAVIFAGISFLQFVCGYGLWTIKPYGRRIQLVLAWIGVLGIPIGTVISILVLVYLYKPGIKALFSGLAPEDISPQDWQEIDLVAKGSTAAVIVAILVVVFGGIIVVGIIAAISIPGLLRARMSGNEAMAIGTLRGLLSGELAYSTVNGGFYDKPECLVTPPSCNSAAGSSPFLDTMFSSRFEKSGYRFVFEGRPSTGSAGPSPSSVQEFVFYAMPIVQGSTGSRSFCTMETGVICSVADGPLQPERGRCPSGCSPLF
jgi:hypothetical protein